jgi:chemotaxis signal transduction protein
MAAKFKGVDLDSDLERIIPHLASAEEYGGALQHLQSVWDNLTLLGQLSGTTTDMSATRFAFRDLAQSLINQLGHEALKKCLQDLGAKAQVAINILVRNLFERTADIGFLACDEDIRAFLRADADTRAQRLEALRSRFGEYVGKYSVYSDIVVLDRRGQVLARLDPHAPVIESQDPCIREALTTKAAYVESFRESDLIAGGKRALIYAFRVADRDGGVLGVLCLCFRLENEAELIFGNLVAADDWAVVTMLDQAGTVIASSDRFHVPVGATFQPVLDAQYRIVRFGPAEYIALTRPAQPYQGYAGPGWYGHVMIPLQHAFDAAAGQALAIDAAMIERTIHGSRLFNDEIRGIPAKAEHIQRELNRSIWNGNLKQREGTRAADNAFSKTLLREISNTGAKTKDVFQSSIADLNTTIVTSLLHDNGFHAALAIDIMDRNLYERANDCRWWALTSAFADLLGKPALSADDVAAIRAILRTINGLYTVYSNLIVFDRAGRIVAVSDPASEALEGTVLEDEWVARVLALHGAEAYAVSAFAETPLYAGRPTYIYGAAIADRVRGSVLGGVAIVFDAAPQFAAMVADALPRTDAGEVKEGCFGALVESGGRVIACSDARFAPGAMLTLPSEFLALAPGASHAGFAVLGDGTYAVGARASAGYREYKGAGDAYCNGVVALTFTRLCGAEAQAVSAPRKVVAIRSDRMPAGGTEDVATFFVGERLFAARARDIVEAIAATGITPLPMMPHGMAGCLIYDGKPLPVFDLFRVLADTGAALPDTRAPTQLLVMASADGRRLGVLVDSLGEIAEVVEDRITFLPAMVASGDRFADAALVPDNENDNPIVVLSADQLCANLVDSAAAVAAA